MVGRRRAAAAAYAGAFAVASTSEGGVKWLLDGGMMMDGRIEKIARALCALDGQEPGEMVSDGNVGAYDVDDIVISNPVPTQQWTKKIAEAERFLACFDAIHPSNAEADRFATREHDGRRLGG